MARTYREAGVDREEAARAVERIAKAAASTATPAVLGGVGGFGALFRFDPSTHPDPVLVSSTDGVGTKLKVALALGRHETIGIDLVNACVNDIVVSGADPLFFLDYLALGELRADVVEEIVGGVAAGCAAAGIPLVGGETAQMPDLYRGDDYDLAGFVVGVVARADIIDGSAVRSGDVLLGLPSSGLHTNGYSLARRVLPETIWAEPMPNGRSTIGEALLEPHRSYLDEVRLLRRELRTAGTDIRALAHLTGGGWEGNLPRTLPGRPRGRGRDGILARPGDLQPDPAARRHRRRRDGSHLQPRHRDDRGRARRLGRGGAGGAAGGVPHRGGGRRAGGRGARPVRMSRPR